MLRQLQNKVRRLRRQSQTTDLDTRATAYIRYLNIFASYYANHGRQEWAKLVGSTREKTKLRSARDQGDWDIIFCSRRLEIPAENLVHREDTPCFVWIKGNDAARDLGITLIDDEYIPSDILRTVTPELFILSRTAYVLFSSSALGADSYFTETGIQSKVGLALTEFVDLRISEDLDGPRKSPEGNSGDIVGTSEITIQQEAYDDEMPPFQNDLDADSDEDTVAYTKQPDNTVPVENRNTFPKQYRATYQHTSSKDFVPVMKVSGKLKCMDEWRKRPRQKWPKPKDVEHIYKCKMYVVSKFAPISPDQKRDFCLSFNEAEYELSRVMNEVQRDVMLILKAYLKGVYTKAHEENKLNLRLTSFHLKTALYWVSEEQVQPWTNRDISDAIVLVLSYLQNSLERKRLDHYFIESNLFAGFPEEEFGLLIESTKSILDDPLRAIDVFFELDDNWPIEMVLTEEEKNALTKRSSDDREETLREMIKIVSNDFDRADADRDQSINRDVLFDAFFAVVLAWVEDLKDPTKRVQEKYFPDDEPRGFMKLFPLLCPELTDHLESTELASKHNEGAAFSTKQAILDCVSFCFDILTSGEKDGYGVSHAETSDHQRGVDEVGENFVKTVLEYMTLCSKFNPDEEKKSSAKKKLIQCAFEFIRASWMISK